MSQRPLLIAVVDDEETICRALRRLLCSLGFHVEVFLSGSEFLTWVADGRPDCVVLDLHMSGVDGFKVLAQMHDLAPTIPIVVITGHDTVETENRVRHLHAAAYLRKPIEGEILVAAIRESIGGA